MTKAQEKKLQQRITSAERLCVELSMMAQQLSTLAMQARAYLEQIRNELYFTRKKEIDDLLS